jgi:hypothetical protein
LVLTSLGRHMKYRVRKLLACFMVTGTIVSIRPSMAHELGAMMLCQPLSPSITDLIKRDFPGWRILSLRDLDFEDQVLWKREGHGRCPGYVTADFYGEGVKSSAVTLIRVNPGQHLEQVLIIIKNPDQPRPIVLSPPEHVDRLSVLAVLPRGNYASPEGEGEVNTRYPGVAYEVLEAGSLLFYWDGSHFASLQISE